MLFWYLCLTMELFLKTYGNVGGGYLGNLVKMYRNKFIEDLRNLPLLNLKVRLEKAPPGYVDDPAWNEESVLRLVDILQSSPNTPPSLRRIMDDLPVPAPTRRFGFGFNEFPSLAQNINQDIYYDVVESTVSTDIPDLSAESTTYRAPNDKDVIYVSNPVEARLPSAHITIGLLKEILLSRAEAARYMPTTKTRYTWTYKPVVTAETKADKGTESGSNPTQNTETKTDKGSESGSNPTQNTETKADKGTESGSNPTQNTETKTDKGSESGSNPTQNTETKTGDKSENTDLKNNKGDNDILKPLRTNGNIETRRKDEAPSYFSSNDNKKIMFKRDTPNSLSRYGNTEIRLIGETINSSRRTDG